MSLQPSSVWKACACCVLIGLTVSLLSINFARFQQQPAQSSFVQAHLEHIVTTPSDVSDNSFSPQSIQLTIDNDMEKLVKRTLYQAMLQNKSRHSTAVILDAKSGAVKALASLANPVLDCSVRKSCGVTDQHSVVTAWEPGSVMKPLLVAAALNESMTTPQSHYYDKGSRQLQGREYLNATLYPPQIMTTQDILDKSLNTGAIHILESLGGGDLNMQARQTWYDYLTEHYYFSHKTGIELPSESAGEVRPPRGGRSIQTQYAGMSFGIGLTVTPIQLATAYGALVNGGVYYQPHLTFKGPQDKPQAINRQVIAQSVSRTMVTMLQQVLTVNNPDALHPGYILGSKSGTAPTVGADGAYKVGADNGAYVGFIGKESPQYIVLVQFEEPATDGFASFAARDTWTAITKDLITEQKVN